MTQIRQLFGTDGVRGVAGEFPLTRESTYLIGRALGHDLLRSTMHPRVLIGQDTRESSPWIADRVMWGLASTGIKVSSAGVITTPGVAYLTRSGGYAAGVVISASHNPWTDNGIKVFSRDGYKLPDSHEAAIEQEIFSLLQSPKAQVGSDESASSLPGEAGLAAQGHRDVGERAGGDQGDLARGGRNQVDDQVGGVHSLQLDGRLGEAGADNCGALYPETVAKAVAESKGTFDLGITFDGDADRALFSDAAGRVVNGDGALLLAARDLQARALLKQSTVVATTMSNMGLEIALRSSGIRMLRANVGDKYVLEEMLKCGATLGGEQSGHIIFRDGEATTGDGLLTALRVMEIMARTNQSLAESARRYGLRAQVPRSTDSGRR